MVNDTRQKVNKWLQDNKSDLLLAGLVFLMLAASFGLGRLSVLWTKKPEISISEPQNRGGDSQSASINQTLSSDPPSPEATAGKGKYVASKSGTAYHYPWCPGAQKIKETNKLWFQTKEEAVAKGYKPAGNCPGL